MIGWLRVWPVLLLAAACPIAVVAQSIPAPIEAPAPAPSYVRVPANTPVDLEILDPLGSKTSRIDAMFALRLADPILVGGAAVLPAGTPGQGQVVHAAKAGMMGKAGELILAARYLQCGDIRIALRGFHFGRTGESRDTTALAVTALVPLGALLVRGGDVVVASGTRANARLTSAVDLPAGSAPCVAAAATVPASIVPAPAAEPADVQPR